MGESSRTPPHRDRGNITPVNSANRLRGGAARIGSVSASPANRPVKVDPTDIERDAEWAVLQAMSSLRQIGRPQVSQTVPPEAVKSLMERRGKSVTLDDAWSNVTAAVIRLQAGGFIFVSRDPKIAWRQLK